MGVGAHQSQFEVAYRHIQSARGERGIAVAAVNFSLIVDIEESPVATRYFQVYGRYSLVVGLQVESDSVGSAALQIVGADVLSEEDAARLRHDHEAAVPEVDVRVGVPVETHSVLVVVELE